MGQPWGLSSAAPTTAPWDNILAYFFKSIEKHTENIFTHGILSLIFAFEVVLFIKYKPTTYKGPSIKFPCLNLRLQTEIIFPPK